MPRTSVQSQSSSSAISIGNAVCVPWPNSSRFDMISTVLSGLILMKAFGSSGPFGIGAPPLSCASASGAAPGRAKPSSMPPLASTLAFRKRRRSTGCATRDDSIAALPANARPNAPSSACSPTSFGPATAISSKRMGFSYSDQGARRILDGGTDALIGATAADIAGHRVVDVGIARPLVHLEQADGAHDLAALAVAALRHIVLDPRGLHLRADGILADGLDGRDLLPRSRRYRCHARANCLSVEMHGASATECGAAAELGAGQTEVVAQCPKDGCRRIRVDLN